MRRVREREAVMRGIPMAKFVTYVESREPKRSCVCDRARKVRHRRAIDKGRQHRIRDRLRVVAQNHCCKLVAAVPAA